MQSVTIVPRGHGGVARRVTVPAITSEQERLALFDQLTPIQQRAILLREPGDTVAQVAAKIGRSEATIHDWLIPSGHCHSLQFRLLWYHEIGNVPPAEYLARLLELYGPLSVERVNKVAAILDACDPLTLPPRTLAVAARAALRLVELVLERADRYDGRDTGLTDPDRRAEEERAARFNRLLADQEARKLMERLALRQAEWEGETRALMPLTTAGHPKGS